MTGQDDRSSFERWFSRAYGMHMWNEQTAFSIDSMLLAFYAGRKASRESASLGLDGENGLARTNCFGVPDTYKGWEIHQGPNDLYYASVSAETWEDLREVLDGLAALSPAPGATAQDGVDLARLCERVFRAGHHEGWTGNQLRRDTAMLDADRGWSLYVSNGALAKSIGDAATPTPTIPAGMVAWNGGDSAPEDWDGGAVYYANGVTARPLDDGDWQRPADIPLIAYTPLAAAPKQAEQQGVERAARAMCVADGLDPDEHIIGGQATGFEDFGPLWQAEERSEGQLGLTNYKRLALAALNAPTGAVETGEAK